MNEVGVDAKLTLWSKQLEIPEEEIFAQYKEVLGKCSGNGDAAIKQLYIELKRQKKRLESLTDISGTILAMSRAKDVAKNIQNNTGVAELYVANTISALDSGQLCIMSLWGKDAVRTDIPELVHSNFKARKVSEDSTFVQLSGSDITFETDGEEKRLSDFKEQLKPITTTLKGLEEYFTKLDTRAGRNLVCVKGIVLSVSAKPSQKGNYVLTLDELSDFADEDYGTTIVIPERHMIDIKKNDEIIVLGDCWKPQEEDGTFGRVLINAWNMENLGGSTISVEA